MLPDVDSPPVGTAEPVSASVRGPADVPGLDPIPVPSPATVTSGSGRWVLEWAVVLAAALLLCFSSTVRALAQISIEEATARLVAEGRDSMHGHS